MGIARRVNTGAVANGTSVTLSIGGADLVMGYEDALKLSQVIRVAAKRAKSNAGDNSRSWSVAATLEDGQTHFLTGR